MLSEIQKENKLQPADRALMNAIAACMYPIPDAIAERCNNILTDDLREIMEQFLREG